MSKQAEELTGFEKWADEKYKGNVLILNDMFANGIINPEDVDEYAKEQAIDFAYEISRNWYKLDVNKYTFPYSSMTAPNEVFTIEEIHKKWKGDKNE